MEAISNPLEDESGTIVAAVAIVTSIAAATVVARLYVRTVMIRSLGWDDIAITVTMMFAIVGFALVVVQANNGAGKHRGDVPPDVYQFGMHVNFASQPIYLYAVCLVKIAVGAALIRIAVVKFYRYLILGIMGFMLFYTVGCMFTVLFQCSNIKVLWDPTVEATCWDVKTIQSLSYTNAALNMLTDLLFSLIIPLPMLWNLHVNLRTRVTLMCILGLGLFACAAAAVKISYLPNYGKKGDFLWDSRNITIWTATEVNVGITAASLPTLRPLFKSVLGSTYGFGSRGASQGKKDRKSWQAIPETKNKSAGFNSTGDTESQMGFELERRDLKAFVNDKSTTTTAISQSRTRDEDDFDVDELPIHQGRNIHARTVMSVQYSDR